MILLFDIGNTHAHVGLANTTRVVKQINVPTTGWKTGASANRVQWFIASSKIEGVALCSVVPKITPIVTSWIKKRHEFQPIVLTPKTVRHVGIDYPKPNTIGPDRLANAVAVRHHYGAPAVVVDFGTAVTFDVVDRNSNYVGGIIAPGLSAMTSYLHEKTALLPKIEIREESAIIGKNTKQAMLIGAVHGYRGLVRELIAALKRELKAPRLPVVATGGYAKLMAAKLPEITAVDPLLTLEGLRLTWVANNNLPRMAVYPEEPSN